MYWERLKAVLNESVKPLGFGMWTGVKNQWQIHNVFF